MRTETNADPEKWPTRRASTQSIALTISLLASVIRRSANMTYNTKLGLSSIAWTMIARLGADGPMTQTEMAEKYLIDKGQLSRTAGELAKKGLILRENRNWRTLQLSLAPAGRKAYAAIGRISRARHRTLVGGLSEQELRSLYKSLDKISINAGAILNQLKVELAADD